MLFPVQTIFSLIFVLDIFKYGINFTKQLIEKRNNSKNKFLLGLLARVAQL